MMEKPRFLLHMCCAPCSPHIINVLRKEFTVDTFFFNPNIHPKNEYDDRLSESQIHSKKIDIRFHSGRYSVKDWMSKVKGHENDKEGEERCNICYRIRLEETAIKAKKEGFGFFGTTLSVSPHKNADVINAIGSEIGKNHGVSFFEANFKKKDGFKKSVALSKKYEMKRQDYCGCIFSKNKK